MYFVCSVTVVVSATAGTVVVSATAGTFENMAPTMIPNWEYAGQKPLPINTIYANVC